MAILRLRRKVVARCDIRFGRVYPVVNVVTQRVLRTDLKILLLDRWFCATAARCEEWTQRLVVLTCSLVTSRRRSFVIRWHRLVARRLEHYRLRTDLQHPGHRLRLLDNRRITWRHPHGYSTLLRLCVPSTHFSPMFPSYMGFYQSTLSTSVASKPVSHDTIQSLSARISQ